MIDFPEKMTLETVLNWLTEHAVKYNHNNLLSLLAQYFPYYVPHEATFPNKEWLVVLGLLDKMLRYRRKKQRKNVAVDQSLKSCEFWRRLQKLLVNIYRETKEKPFLKRNDKRFIDFIRDIKLIEVMIFSKEFLAPQLDVKMGDNLIMDTQSQGMDKDQNVFGKDVVNSIKNDVEDRIQEIVPFAQKEFANKVDVKIISLLQDDFIIDLRQFISRDILKSQPTGLEKFLGCRDDFETSTDPYMKILVKHTKVSIV